MIKQINNKIKNLEKMKKYPKNLSYIGNLNLLEKKKISIVGSRKPDNYSRTLTYEITSNVTYNNKLKYTRINLNGVDYEN